MVGNDPYDPFLLHEMVGPIKVWVDRACDESSSMEPHNHGERFILLPVAAGVVDLELLFIPLPNFIYRTRSIM